MTAGAIGPLPPCTLSFVRASSIVFTPEGAHSTCTLVLALMRPIQLKFCET